MSEQYLAELMSFFLSTKPHSGCIQRVTQPETSHEKEEVPDAHSRY